MIETLLTSKLSNAAATGYLLLDSLLLIVIMYIMKLIFSNTEPMMTYITNKIKYYFSNEKPVIIIKPYVATITRETVLVDNGWTEQTEDKSNKNLLDALYEKINTYDIVSRNSAIGLSASYNSYAGRHAMLQKQICWRSMSKITLPNGIIVNFGTIDGTEQQEDPNKPKNNNPPKQPNQVKKEFLSLSHTDYKVIKEFMDEAWNEWIDKYFPEAEVEEKKIYFYQLIKQDENKRKYMRLPLENSSSWNNFFVPNKEKLTKVIDMFSRDLLKMKKMVFLLHGKPGTGKTSFVKLLANETKRSILNIKLGMIKDDNELMDIIFNPNIRHTTDSDKVPISDRIYLLEDVDAESDIVLSRKNDEMIIKDDFIKDDDDYDYDDGDKPKATSMSRCTKGYGKYFWDKKLTLSGLLNCLDGVIELHRGIVIMTTNHPEKLDEALVREGRVTVKLELNNMNKPEMLDLLKYHYPDEIIDMDKFNKIEDGKISPAKVENLCQLNWDKGPNDVIDLLLQS